MTDKTCKTNKIIIVYLFLAFASGLLFLWPKQASAALTLPSTPCDSVYENLIVNGFSVHLAGDLSVKEDGIIAFKYGSDNNSFVVDAGDYLEFDIRVLLPAGSPNPIVKLMALDGACNAVYGIGPVFFNINFYGENFLRVHKSGSYSEFNDVGIPSFPSSMPRYFWVEVWDGGAIASYSYLVDVSNPQNPTGTVDGEEPSGRRPVLIVPGIGGSTLYNDNDFVWPNINQMYKDINDQFIEENLRLTSDGESINSITAKDVVADIVLSLPQLGIKRIISDIFRSLLLELEAAGYEFKSSYFGYAYDWRLDLHDTSDLLNQRIELIKNQTGFEKIDIIAHSMGGLLVKSYLDEYGKGDINKLIFIGTPHLGAPKAAKVLLEGDRFGISWLEEDRIQEVAVNSPAVYQLLPNQKYFDTFTGYIRDYSFYSTNPILDYSATRDFLLDKGLNPNMFAVADGFLTKHLEELDFSGIDVYNIAGCKKGETPAGYYFGILGNISRIGYTSGDETVPLVSARYLNIPEDRKFYVKNGKHSELPSTNGVRELILGILTGNIDLEANVSSSDSFCGFRGKELIWKSPVEVHIYDSLGNHTGPIENNGIEYGIPGVGYDIFDHQKFIFLPTDEGQEYQIVAQGIDSGTLDLLISENDNGIVTHTKVFNDISINPESKINLSISDQSADNLINLDLSGIGDFQTVQADATLNQQESEDFVPPETTLTTSGVQGNNGWYKSNVDVTLVPLDVGSDILKTLYSLDNGENFMNYLAPVTITKEGTTTIQFYSIDRAGNNEEVKVFEIKADKTPPELTVEFSLTNKDYIFNAVDNLDFNPDIICTETSCQAHDDVGNQTLLEFKKEYLLLWKTLRLKKISFNGEITHFPDNALIVKYAEKRGVLQDFNQTFLLQGQEIVYIRYVKSESKSYIFTFMKGSGVLREVVEGIEILQLVVKNSTIKAIIK